MTSKTITFSHAGQTVNAEVFYNEKDSQTILLMFPENLITDFDETVLFSKDKEKGWKTASFIYNSNPETIQNIIAAFKTL
jgi:hypothetical protein